MKYKFFDMCTTSGQRAETVKDIFSIMNTALSQYDVSCVNCVCPSVDNTSVNLGV